MEIKKTEEASIEKKKISLFLLGLTIASIFVLLGFELRSALNSKLEPLAEKAGMDDEIIEEVVMQENTPPPPPEPEVIEVVDDKKEVKEQEIAKTTEVDQKIEIFDEPVAPKVEQIFTVVEKNPSFPGGEEKLFEYLGKSISYPQMAKEAGVKGKVYVQFVVEKNGAITDIKIIRGIGSGCDEEAKKAVKNMPKWEPGEQRGKPVRVRFVLPVNFSLR